MQELNNIETSFQKKWSIWRKLAVALLCIITAALSIFFVSALVTILPGERMVPAGMKRNTAVYVTMRDGVKIAVDIWVPEDLKLGEKLPVVTEMTRYWRAGAVGWAGRGAYGLGLNDIRVPFEARHFNPKRFAILYIDSRGTGASGGNRASEWTPDEIRDYGEVIRWAARQPWSNGRVGAFGVSYSGNTAELVAALGEPALKAVAPGYNDFDPLLFNSMPGGAFNTGFTTKWSNAVTALDENDICTLAEANGIMCWFTKAMVPGVKLVDADPDGRILSDILKSRKAVHPVELLGGTVYLDQIGGRSGGVQAGDISPFSAPRRAALEKLKIPMLVFAGWLDAGSGEGSLRRFATFDAPQEMYIGMFSHGGGYDTDPLAAPAGPLGMSEDEQLNILTAFFEKYLRSDTAAPMTGKVLHYFTAGERDWKRTDRWPVAGTKPSILYFGSAKKLETQLPNTDGTDNYEVDFTAEVGKETRYHTQDGGIDVIYPDRKKQGQKLLVYDGAPLEQPLTITGTPVVTLNMASTHSDGLIIAYLEAVAPNGDVKYITEGVLRVIHHKETTDPQPYAQFGVARSFAKKDGAPLVPGVMTKIRIPMFATSIRIPKGYRIRVALAGAAKGLFDRYPEKGNPTWTVSRSSLLPSFVDLPTIPDTAR